MLVAAHMHDVQPALAAWDRLHLQATHRIRSDREQDSDGSHLHLLGMQLLRQILLLSQCQQSTTKHLVRCMRPCVLLLQGLMDELFHSHPAEVQVHLRVEASHECCKGDGGYNMKGLDHCASCQSTCHALQHATSDVQDVRHPECKRLYRHWLLARRT